MLASDTIEFTLAGDGVNAEFATRSRVPVELRVAKKLTMKFASKVSLESSLHQVVVCLEGLNVNKVGKSTRFLPP